VPAFVGMGTPHWEPEARGTITGLTRGTSRAHLVRAALEAMAFSSADLLTTMASAEHLNVPALRVDGGAAANDWLMQFQADLLGIPVERPDLVETTALGAEYGRALQSSWPDGNSPASSHRLELRNAGGCWRDGTAQSPPHWPGPGHGLPHDRTLPYMEEKP
jgi:glycerol kinase